LEINLIFSENQPMETFTIQSHKELIMQQLTPILQTFTLGEVLQDTMTKTNCSPEELSAMTGLDLNVIEGLKTDQIFTNSIPIHGLRRLLTTLKISFDQAETAIYSTFEKLIAVPSEESTSFALKHRRRWQNERLSFTNYSGDSKSKGKYLYKNKPALSKYVKRLQELYTDLEE